MVVDGIRDFMVVGGFTALENRAGLETGLEGASGSLLCTGVTVLRRAGRVGFAGFVTCCGCCNTGVVFTALALVLSGVLAKKLVMDRCLP